MTQSHKYEDCFEIAMSTNHSFYRSILKKGLIRILGAQKHKSENHFKVFEPKTNARPVNLKLFDNYTISSLHQGLGSSPPAFRQ